MTGPVFETLDDVSYGEAEQVSPMIRRVIAENPSKFTYHGTGTYIMGGDHAGRGDVAVIDPGPGWTAIATHSPQHSTGARSGRC